MKIILKMSLPENVSHDLGTDKGFQDFQILLLGNCSIKILVITGDHW